MRLFVIERKEAFLFALLIGITSTQNLLAIMLSRFSGEMAKIAIVVKDLYLGVVLIAVVGYYVLRLLRGRLPKRGVETWVLAVLLMIGVVSFFSPSFNMMSLRQLLIIPFFLIFGFYFSRRTNIERVSQYVLFILAIVCLSGYLERFLLYDVGENFWNMAGIAQYMRAKGMELWLSDQLGGVPGNFYSMDLYDVAIRRMCSLLLAEPTLLGQMLVFPTLYCLLTRKWTGIFFFGIALLCTLSKGGLFALMIGYALHYRDKASGRFKSILLMLATAAVFGLLVYSAFNTNRFDSVVKHFTGLTYNALELYRHPFTMDVGGSGNLALLFGAGGDVGSDMGDTGGESYVGAVIGQLKLVGLALYLLLMWHVYRLKVSESDHFALAIKYSVLSTLIAGFVSESAISYVGTGYLFALWPFLYKRGTNIDTESRQVIQ